MNLFEVELQRYFTAKEIDKIRRVSVGIAGAGGLGSNCAAILVRSGFRNLTIADFDVVEAGNLNRQQFALPQLGRLKTEALAENLYQINPELNLRLICDKIGAANAESVFSHCDILIEAFDRVESKTMLAEIFVRTGKFFVAASGIAGCGNSDRIRTRRVRENFWIVGDFESGVERLPPLAPCVTIAAAKQADLVLEYVLRGANDEGVARTGNGELQAYGNLRVDSGKSVNGKE